MTARTIRFGKSNSFDAKMSLNEDLSMEDEEINYDETKDDEGEYNGEVQSLMESYDEINELEELMAQIDMETQETNKCIDEFERMAKDETESFENDRQTLEAWFEKLSLIHSRKHARQKRIIAGLKARNIEQLKKNEIIKIKNETAQLLGRKEPKKYSEEAIFELANAIRKLEQLRIKRDALADHNKDLHATNEREQKIVKSLKTIQNNFAMILDQVNVVSRRNEILTPFKQAQLELQIAKNMRKEEEKDATEKIVIRTNKSKKWSASDGSPRYPQLTPVPGKSYAYLYRTLDPQ